MLMLVARLYPGWADSPTFRKPNAAKAWFSTSAAYVCSSAHL